MIDSRLFLQQVVEQFTPDSITTIEALGKGNINTTYLVTTSRQPLVLQRINRQVFPSPTTVVENFAIVARHLEEKQRLLKMRYRFAHLLPTISGNAWFEDDAGEIWRAQSYLAGRSLPTVRKTGQAHEIGRALGCFHVLISDLAVEQLHDPLPGFHILPGYLAQFDSLASSFQGPGSADLDQCLAIVEHYRQMAPLLQQAGEQGHLHCRIIHGDPKVDNFLFDTGFEHAVSLIDLDTIGPGLLHYDLGDCLRSCCNRGGESGDPQRIDFDMDSCRAFLSGYKQEMGDSLSRHDKEYLYAAVLLISFELGLRFLTDHLRGNTYFTVRRVGENLQRALVQFALAKRIAQQEETLRTLL